MELGVELSAGLEVTFMRDINLLQSITLIPIPKPITCGVPQDSTLGPLLFIVYVMICIKLVTDFT